MFKRGHSINMADEPGPTLLRSRAAQVTAIACLYVMAGMARWSVTLVHLAEIILFVIAVVIGYRARKELVKQPLFWLTVFFVLYVIMRGWIAGLERPDLLAQHWEAVRRWVKAGLLPALVVALVMWGVGRREKHTVCLFLTALIGFTALLLTKADWGELWRGVNGDVRYTFSLHVAFSSLLFTLALLGTLVYWPRVVALAPPWAAWRILFGITWAVIPLFYLTVLVATGTRASWIAGVVGVLTVGWVCLGMGFWRPSARSASVVATGLAVVLTIGALFFGDRVAERWAGATDAISAAVALPTGGKLEDVPRDPLGIRVAYNVFGLRHLEERPIFGYGPAEPRYLRYEHEVPHQLEDRNDHFHSQYIDPLLRFGAIGFLPVFSLFVLAVVGVFRGWRRETLSRESGLFILGFVAVYAVWSLADQRFTNYTMVAIVSLITGSSCSHLFPTCAVAHANKKEHES